MPLYERRVDDKMPKGLRRTSMLEMIGSDITDLAGKNPSAAEPMLRLCELMKLDRRFEGHILRGVGKGAEQVKGGFSTPHFLPEPSFIEKVISFRDRQRPTATLVLDKFLASEEVKEQVYPLLEFVRILMGEKLPYGAKRPEWHDSFSLLVIRGRLEAAMKNNPFTLIKR